MRTLKNHSHIFLLLTAALLFVVIAQSCKSVKDKPAHRPTKDPTVYKGVINKDCAAEMSYGSYGAGIDDSAYTATMLLISRWNQTYTATNIGREGETRLCMPLQGMKRRERRAFIDSLKIIAKAGQLVSVSIR